MSPNELGAQIESAFPIKLLKIVTTLKNGGFDHEGKSKKSNGHWD
jgi:hypothetical protein